MSSLYERLGENDIRLLTVTVHDGATASLEIHTYPRTAALEYDAVSYTWGDDESAVSVPCNGLSLKIRTNLFRALPFIHESRPEPRTRPLWVDAICLNQGDPDEKAIHVPQMNEVYENASRTLVWLGEADKSSDLALDNIESLTQKLWSVKDPASLSIMQRITNYDLPLLDDDKWKAIKLLQQRLWFYRLWTFQEIILSKEIVILCGRKSTSWNALSDLHEAAIQAMLSTMVKPEADPKTPYKSYHSAIGHVNTLRKIREGGMAMTLPMLLLYSVYREYTVPVDRVWALLGLLNKGYRQLIRDAELVDYKIPISKYHEVFLGVVKFHIKHDTAMAMQLIEDNLRTAHNPLLPSWCPDWHTNKGGIPLARDPEALAGIPGGKFYRIEPFMKYNEDSSLELCGLTVDVIERVTVSAGEDMLDLESYPWLTQCWEIIKSTPFVPYDVYPASAVIPAVPATFPGDVPINEQRQRYMRMEELLKYVLFPPGTPLDTSARTILKCNGRKFFRTKAGRLGIGPADLKENDILCSMYGARTIWALRPRNPPENARGQEASELSRQDTEDQEFELLGSAYTPSLFKGEAWVGTSCESMQRFKLR
jgi:hypothetical protein